MLARIRKAVVAGVTAGLGAAITALVAAGKVDAESIAQALGALVAVGAPVAWATWRVPNASN